MINENVQNVQNAQKNTLKYHCEVCDYLTHNKAHYSRHELTAKHYRLTNTKKYICRDCGKKYVHQSSYCKHKKSCTPISKKNSTETISTETIIKLLKENNELKQTIIETQNKNVTLAEEKTTINNNTFNLQVFLNETCKDAMNITDFVNSLKLQLCDLEKMGEIGYVNGMSNIIIKNFK